jgi:hypothetical protein
VLDHVPGAMPFEIAWPRDGAPDGRADLYGLLRVGSTWTALRPPARLIRQGGGT